MLFIYRIFLLWFAVALMLACCHYVVAVATEVTEVIVKPVPLSHTYGTHEIHTDVYCIFFAVLFVYALAVFKILFVYIAKKIEEF